MTHPVQKRHKWDHDNKRVILPADSEDGNERHERECLQCHIVKVTVIPPQDFPWHEWRFPGTEHTTQLPRTPHCVPVKPQMVEKPMPQITDVTFP